MTKEEQLEDFRRRWKTADSKSRKLIEIRAKLLKMSMMKPQTPEEKDLDEKIALFL